MAMMEVELWKLGQPLLVFNAMPLKVTKIYGELPDEICLVSVLFILPFTYKLYQSI